MASNDKAYPYEEKDLFLPPLVDLASVLEDGLKNNFKEVSVGVVDCPDLTQSPWHLAAKGLGGSPRIVDIGGVPYLMPLVNKDKRYDLSKVARLAGVPDAFIIGAGAASYLINGVNSEMMPNVKITNGSAKSCTHIASVNKEDGSAVLELCQSLETGPLANVLVCQGEAGLVLEIRAKIRTGPENFVTCMRKAINKEYGDKPIGLGGAFIIEKGKAKLHVMPDFSPTPLTSDEDVKQWLKYYDMSAPLICLSEFVSHDPGLDLRIEHTHCFSNHGEGGHYHYDITPDEVEYHGYYTVAEKIVRIDKPTITHQIGRD